MNTIGVVVIASRDNSRANSPVNSSQNSRANSPNPTQDVRFLDVGPADPGRRQHADTTDTETQAESVAGRTYSQVLDVNAMMQVNKLRRKLRFFFADPVDKYRLTGEWPWKLIVQIVKIFLVTTQLVQFGSQRMDHVSFLEDTEVLMRHLLLANWTETRDVTVWPPAQGPYAVYTVNGLNAAMQHVFDTYYTLNTTTFNAFDYAFANNSQLYPPIHVCQNLWAYSQVYPANGTYEYDLRTIKECRDFSLTKDERGRVRKDASYVPQVFTDRNLTLEPTQLNDMVWAFNLKTIRGRGVLVFSKPACFDVKVFITFNNNEHTGVVKIFVTTDLEYAHPCSGNVIDKGEAEMPHWLLFILDLVVLACCLFSFVLCSRALVRAQILCAKTVSYFDEKLNIRLSSSDRLEFLNLWYVMIVANDCMIISGTLFKMSIEYSERLFQAFDDGTFTTASLLLGSGTMLVWCGILRYLGFFSQYNILILTIKKSLPNVLRFLVCASFLYAGFMFWGWIVLGPYSAKFRSLFLSFSNMFALINGDDMFATFYTLNEKTPAVVTFASRVYLVIFLSLFIYVVLSLFISIIMDAYEIVKERLQPDDSVGALRSFIDEDRAPLVRMHRYERHLSVVGRDSVTDRAWLRLKSACCSCCPVRRRNRTRSAYEQISDDEVSEQRPLVT